MFISQADYRGQTSGIDLSPQSFGPLLRRLGSSMSAISAARWRQLRTHNVVNGSKSLHGVRVAGMARHRQRQSQGNSAVPASAVHLPELEIS
jgi:hypothetical protein